MAFPDPNTKQIQGVLNGYPVASIATDIGGVPVAQPGGSADEFQIAASATYVASTNFDGLLSQGRRGVRLFVDVTAIAGGTSANLALRFKDPVTALSNQSSTLNPIGVINANGLWIYVFYPGVSADQNTPLSRSWGLALVVNGGAPSITCSIGACLIP